MYIIDSKYLAKSIDAYCSFFGIKKQEFHRDSGISSGTLSQWRNGTYEPDKRSIIKLIQYTGLTLDELLSGNFSAIVTQEQKKPGTESDGQMGDLELAVLNASEKQRELVERILKYSDEQVSAFLLMTQGLPTNQPTQGDPEQT